MRGGALIHRLFSERARPAGRLATLSNSCDPAGLKTRAIKCRAGFVKWNDQKGSAGAPPYPLIVLAQPGTVPGCREPVSKSE